MNESENEKKHYNFPNRKNGKFCPFDKFPPLNISIESNLFIASSKDEKYKDANRFFGFGRFVNEHLLLSPYEVMFLYHIGLSLDIPLKANELWKFCCSLCGKSIFPLHYAVYHYFRCRYWVVRDGSLFGAVFVLYKDHPDIVHSTYTVSLVDNWNCVNKVAPPMSRVDWSIKKSRVLVRVIVPNGVDMSDVSCISKFTIETLILKRVVAK